MDARRYDEIETKIATYDQLLLGIDDKLKQALQSKRFGYRSQQVLSDSSSEEDVILDARLKQVQQELVILRKQQYELRKAKKQKSDLITDVSVNPLF